jgi:CheY-like chemotaxis protein
LSKGRDMQGKIMIVDDNPVIVEMLQRKLEKEGFEVLGCVESTKALDTCLEGEPDLIILDILMPGKTGWDIMLELKANPQTEAIPVIVSTVKNRPEDVDKSKELQAADYIAKPYVFSDLLDKIGKILAK